MNARNAILLVMPIIVLCTPAFAKTGSTLYPPDRVANARRNIQRYAWARDIRDRALEAADAWAKQPDDFLWNLITPQSIPRGTQVNILRGCPKCGKAIEKFGGHPWKCSVLKRPWKITCPNCGESFPKNDFGRFYESGKDEHGIFRPELADRSLLFNTDHPDPKDPLHTYAVDDGMGWKDDKGSVYRFIGYYGHYGIWSTVISALTSLKNAYLYTGNPVYARKAGLTLYRIAEFYPDMDWSYWSKLGFNNSDGGTGRGKIYGCIWETGVADTFVSVYDAIYPGLNDPQPLSELTKKTGGQVTAADLRSFIEKNIVREVHDSILSRKIEGNEGMYQNAMATAAVVLDEPGTSEEWLDWIFKPGNMRRGGASGGNIPGLFESEIDDDGMGAEASPMYNGIWRNKFKSIFDILERCPAYKGHKAADFPKYRRMFETPVRLICLGKFIPNIGDCGKTGSPGLGIKAEDIAYAYRTFRDPKFAQMAWFLSKGKTNELRGSIFDPDPEAAVKQIEAVVKEKGPYIPKTEEMPSYGLTILRGGSGANARALSIYYGRNMGHGHKDTLNIDLFGFGLDLMPDIGYPEHASDWPARYEWTSNTISHNTVVVDQIKQNPSIRGKSNFVVEGKGVSAAEVFADQVYPQTSLYQRTVAMVDISDKDFYVVDIFRIKGGSEHLYSLHGAEGEVETEGLNLTTQPKGTLAGEHTGIGADIGLAKNYGAKATGFQYLYGVRRDTHPSAQPAITYKVVDTWHLLKKPQDIRLRINLISPPGEVILAHGDPPQNKQGNPRRLTYILAPHKASDSTFVSVIEPYSGARTIKKIKRRDDGDTVTLTITTASGRIDTIISSLKPGSRFTIASEDKGITRSRLIAR